MFLEQGFLVLEKFRPVLRIDHPVKELVQTVGFYASFQVERVGARQFFRAGKLLPHVL